MTTSDRAQIRRSCDRRTALNEIKFAAFAAAVLAVGAVPAFGQDGAAEINPAPAAIGADVPATYFGPQPSAVQRELVGAYQNLKSAKSISRRERLPFRSTMAR